MKMLMNHKQQAPHQLAVAAATAGVPAELHRVQQPAIAGEQLAMQQWSLAMLL
jgi:hypothetical protein